MASTPGSGGGSVIGGGGGGGGMISALNASPGHGGTTEPLLSGSSQSSVVAGWLVSLLSVSWSGCHLSSVAVDLKWVG